MRRTKERSVGTRVGGLTEGVEPETVVQVVGGTSVQVGGDTQTVGGPSSGRVRISVVRLSQEHDHSGPGGDLDSTK